MSRTIAAVVLVLAALAGCSRAPDQSSTLPPAGAEISPVDLLHTWDQRRAAAYAAGSVEDLRRLYVDGSTAGRADVRMLHSYVARGLVVDGMTTQVLSLDVLRVRPSTVRLRITDRLAGAEARSPTRSWTLPRDSPSSRVVTLRYVEGRWLMAAVTAGRN